MSEYTVYLPSRFWTAAGCPWTVTAVSCPAGKELRAPMLATCPMAPDTVGGGLRKRTTG